MTYGSVIRMNSYKGLAIPTIFHLENIEARQKWLEPKARSSGKRAQIAKSVEGLLA